MCLQRKVGQPGVRARPVSVCQMESTAREVCLVIGDNALLNLWTQFLGFFSSGSSRSSSGFFRYERRAPDRGRISTFSKGGPDAGRVLGQIGRGPRESGRPRAAWRYLPGAHVVAVCLRYRSRWLRQGRMCVGGYRKLRSRCFVASAPAGPRVRKRSGMRGG